MTDSDSIRSKLKDSRKGDAYRVDPVRGPARGAGADSGPGSGGVDGDPLQAMRALAMPGFDMTAFIDNYRKNLTAFTDSNDILMRSAQSIVTRQAEIFGESMQETVRLLNSVFSAPADERPELTQLRATQELFLKALGNLQEIVEIANRGNSESLQTINRRVDEVLKDLGKTKS